MEKLMNAHRAAKRLNLSLVWPEHKFWSGLFYWRRTAMDKPLKTLETYAFSQLVALVSEAEPNSCFKDAWNALINFPQWFRQSKYAEGWIVLERSDEILVIEHGWCMLPDGRVIDPAIVLLIGPQDPVVYFTGVEYTWEETLAFECELLPRVRFTHYGSDGMGHTDYKAAYDAALSVAKDLSVGYEPSKKITVHTAQPEEEVEKLRQEAGQIIIYIISSDD
jgi:hypothetical protein